MTMIPSRIGSSSAILDVRQGRGALARSMKESVAPSARIPVTIIGWIVREHGADDGISQEFHVEVATVELRHR